MSILRVLQLSGIASEEEILKVLDKTNVSNDEEKSQRTPVEKDNDEIKKWQTT